MLHDTWTPGDNSPGNTAIYFRSQYNQASHLLKMVQREVVSVEQCARGVARFGGCFTDGLTLTNALILLEQDVVLFIVVITVKGTVPAIAMQLSKPISSVTGLERQQRQCTAE